MKKHTPDKDLVHITNILTSIHKQYYQSKKDTTQILKEKKNILDGLKFYCTNTKLHNRIIQYGGILCNKIQDCNYVLVNGKEYKKLLNKSERLNKNENKKMCLLRECKEYGMVVVDEMFVNECVYRMEKVCVEVYVLYDYSNDDEIIEELLL